MVSFHCKIIDLIETHGGCFHSAELVGHLRKVDPNKSGIFDLFSLRGDM